MWKATQGLKDGGFYSPLCWTEESAHVPDNIKSEVAGIIQASDAIVLTIRYGGFSIGGLMILLSAYALGRRHRENAQAVRSYGINSGDSDDSTGEREEEEEDHRLLGDER